MKRILAYIRLILQGKVEIYRIQNSTVCIILYYYYFHDSCFTSYKYIINHSGSATIVGEANNLANRKIAILNKYIFSEEAKLLSYPELIEKLTLMANDKGSEN